MSLFEHAFSKLW